MERLVYGGGFGSSSSSSSMDGESNEEEEEQLLRRVLEWVESKATGCTDLAAGAAVPMPGVVIWCHGCHRMSVISYTYYRFLCKHRDKMPEASIPTLSAYYTKMCISAELWMHMLEMQQQQQRKQH